MFSSENPNANSYTGFGANNRSQSEYNMNNPWSSFSSTFSSITSNAGRILTKGASVAGQKFTEISGNVNEKLNNGISMDDVQGQVTDIKSKVSSLICPRLLAIFPCIFFLSWPTWDERGGKIYRRCSTATLRHNTRTRMNRRPHSVRRNRTPTWIIRATRTTTRAIRTKTDPTSQPIKNGKTGKKPLHYRHIDHELFPFPIDSIVFKYYYRKEILLKSNVQKSLWSHVWESLVTSSNHWRRASPRMDGSELMSLRMT